jgi:hypothetical protein
MRGNCSGPTPRPTGMTRRLLATAAVLGAATLAGACGHGATSTTATTAPPTTTPTSSSCRSTPVLQAYLNADLGTAVSLATTVIVTPGAPSTGVCTLRPGTTTVLTVGERATFIANGTPTFLTPNRGVVAVSTGPGPTQTFAGIATRHVTVTLVAQRPGQVRLTWEDCSGTAC